MNKFVETLNGHYVRWDEIENIYFNIFGESILQMKSGESYSFLDIPKDQKKNNAFHKKAIERINQLECSTITNKYLSEYCNVECLIDLRNLEKEA